MFTHWEEIQVKVTVELTPELLYRIFWFVLLLNGVHLMIW
jgi:hypothetical protein